MKPAGLGKGIVEAMNRKNTQPLLLKKSGEGIIAVVENYDK